MVLLPASKATRPTGVERPPLGGEGGGSDRYLGCVGATVVARGGESRGEWGSPPGRALAAGWLGLVPRQVRRRCP